VISVKPCEIHLNLTLLIDHLHTQSLTADLTTMALKGIGPFATFLIIGSMFYRY